MKILMMHRGDGDAGGGQVQMNRLHAGLKRSRIEARILCREGTQGDSVIMPYRPRAEKWLGKLTKRAGLNDIHLVSSFGVPRLKEVEEADLVDIHCLHSGAFSYLGLPALTAHKPAVFYLSRHVADHRSLPCEPELRPLENGMRQMPASGHRARRCSAMRPLWNGN